MRPWLLALCATLAVGGVLGALPLAPATPSWAQPAKLDPEERKFEAWRLKLEEAHTRRAAAQLRVQSAQNAYREWRQRFHPRGSAKAEVLAEIAAADAELAEASAELPRLVELARREGVPPGVLRAYWD